MGKIELLNDGITTTSNVDIVEYSRLLNIKFEIIHNTIVVDFDDIIHILTCNDSLNGERNDN